MLSDALSLTGEHAAPARIGITAGEDCFVIMRQVTRAANVGAMTGALELSSLRDSATRAGIRISVAPEPGGVQPTWEVPLDRAAWSPAIPVTDA
jgi:hypothetical protein